jgi:hypothetical protein
MVRRPDELLEQLHLQRVGVLELVHRDAGEALAEMFAHIGVLAQDLLAEEQQVVEVHRVLRAQFVLIGDGELAKKSSSRLAGSMPLFLALEIAPSTASGFTFSSVPPLRTSSCFIRPTWSECEQIEKFFL